MKLCVRGMTSPVLVAALMATSCASNKQGGGDAPQAPTAAEPAASAAAPVPSAAPAPEPAPSAAPAPASEPAATGGAGGTTGSESAPVIKDESAPKRPSKLIMAAIHGKSGSKLKGEATLSDKGGQGVKLHVEVEGAKPGTHGIHIHEYADCSAADGSSAGGHFNPEGHEHGLPDKEMRHLGDLGNIVIGQDGKGTLDIVVADANLKDIDPHSFIGRGLIIHEKKDNGGQPVGNAGGRVGCAEIK